MKNRNLKKGLAAICLAVSVCAPALSNVNAATTSQSNSAAYAKSVVTPTSARHRLGSTDAIDWGKTKVGGTAVSGLKLENGTTSGTLSVQLDIQKVADIAWGDKSEYEIKLPSEFSEISKTAAFKNAISGDFHAYNLGIQIKKASYSAKDVQVVNNTVIIDNPKVTDVIGIAPHVTMTMNLDLGKAVTDSGVRIPDATNGYYAFETAMTSNKNVIDWTIGSKDATYKLNTAKLDPGYNHSAPKIITDEKIVEIPLNSTFNDHVALENIQAKDDVDGNISDKVRVESNQVNPFKEGYYNVTYSVVNSIGLKTTKTLKFHVVRDTSASKLTPDAYELNTSNITGTYSGDIASLSLYVNDKFVKNSTTKIANGKFSFYVGDQFIKKNDKLTFKAYNKDGNLVLNNIPVNIKDVNNQGSIINAEYNLGDTNITGLYTGNVAKFRVLINGAPQAFGGTPKDGKFTYYIASNKIKAGDKVTIEAYDINDKLLDTAPVSVNGHNDQGSISNAQYNIGSNSITGLYAGDITKLRVFVNGTAQAFGGTLKDGKFTYYIASNKIKAGDKVTIEGYDAKDVKLVEGNVNVISPNKQTGEIATANYKLNSYTITGTYTGTINGCQVFINGEPEAIGGTIIPDPKNPDKGGSFTYYLDKTMRPLINKNTTVVIKACDASGNILGRGTSVTIID